MAAGSPCRACDNVDGDKNSKECANCEARLEYAMAQGMFPGVKLEESELEEVKLEEGKEVLTMNNREEERVNKLDKETVDEVEKLSKKMVEEATADKKPQGMCEVNGCPEVVLARNKCKKHYGAWRHKNPDKTRKIRSRAPASDEDYLSIRLQIRAGDANPEKRKVLEAIGKIAHAEYRTIHNQAFYFLKCAVDEWEREHGNDDGH